MNAGASRRVMEVRAPSSRICWAEARREGGVVREGTRQFWWRRASLARVRRCVLVLGWGEERFCSSWWISWGRSVVVILRAGIRALWCCGGGVVGDERVVMIAWVFEDTAMRPKVRTLRRCASGGYSSP